MIGNIPIGRTPAILAALLLLFAVAPAWAQPVIASHNGAGDSTEQTSRSVPMPSGIQAGDLLIIHACVMSTGTNPSPTISGWSTVALNSTAPSYIIAAKIAVGGDTATLESRLARAAYSSFRITGFHSSGLSAYEVSSANSGNSETADPPSFDPTGWATEATKWLAIVFKGDNQAIATDPSGYTRIRYDTASGGTGGTECGVITAHKDASAASDDPSAYDWTGTGAEPWYAITGAIRPASAVTCAGARRAFFGVGNCD